MPRLFVDRLWLNSVVTEQNSETEFKMAAPIVTCYVTYELFSLCLDHFGGLNGNFNNSYYCNTLLRISAYSLLILERLVLCQCYRHNSFPGGVLVSSNDRAK